MNIIHFEVTCLVYILVDDLNIKERNIGHVIYFQCDVIKETSLVVDLLYYKVWYERVIDYAPDYVQNLKAPFLAPNNTNLTYKMQKFPTMGRGTILHPLLISATIIHSFKVIFDSIQEASGSMFECLMKCYQLDIVMC